MNHLEHSGKQRRDGFHAHLDALFYREKSYCEVLGFGCDFSSAPAAREDALDRINLKIPATFQTFAHVDVVRYTFHFLQVLLIFCVFGDEVESRPHGDEF